MGTVITIASSKGGCGKTALATILGVGLAARGYSVALLDGDPAASLSSWMTDNYEGPVIKSVAETDNVAIIQRAIDLGEAHDICIIDTAGFASLTSASAQGVADCVLVPCMPDRSSVRECFRTLAQTKSLAVASRRAIPCYVVRTQWNVRGLAEGGVSEDLASQHSPLLETIIPQMSSIRLATLTGIIPDAGRMKDTTEALIAELVRLKAIPQRRGKRGK